MTDGNDKSLAGLEERMKPDDARYARASDSRRPPRPRGNRHGPAWIVMSMAVALLVTGMMLPNGLLIAAALVLAGVGGHLFEHRGAVRHRPYRG
ncbi:DUF3040 domain-containing protein [Streptomyces sp. AK02-01A]|uniref:DUF3040 domain-containing protein n=1 Tax=Streptomyces sp. AK02-01A TaxID=3028648 RepID=UPI0029A8E173|nr:DUF3040 domain-containing protein [Streptomyces sp. AK02-01A]MDX3853693.1 DUF3040 domain-containing protein [Streptomyces sp. AK02-01A]